MESLTLSNFDVLLIQALEENPFDIVGLAEIDPNSKLHETCLGTVNSILASKKEPRSGDRSRLGRVLYILSWVAREQYASNGHQEYWPFLFKQLQENPTFFGRVERSQDYEASLGRWFRAGLQEFSYSIPHDGQANLGPILFHSGIPRSSLPGVIQVIISACKEYGLHAEDLPDEVRKRLVEQFQPHLHRAVQRLLGSRLDGAKQIWSCLSRVVLAWQGSGSCEAELSMLPATIDPQLVRQFLPAEGRASRSKRTKLVQLRYDPESGDVRIVLPFGSPADWLIRSKNCEIPVHWDETVVGLSADLRKPLPQDITVNCKDPSSQESRSFATRPTGRETSEWPGIWFHARTGNLEDGKNIDSAGLLPGRWYVLFEGNPTFCSTGYVGTCPLKWSFTKEGKDWNAFEVDVPERTEEAPDLEWRIGDNSFKIPLARKPGPKLEMISKTSPVLAWNNECKVEVFSEQPSVVLRRVGELDISLVRQYSKGISIIRHLTLSPEMECPLNLPEPGVYQIREAKGIGRILQQFAYIPALQFIGPNQSSFNELASIDVNWDAEEGPGELTPITSPTKIENGDGIEPYSMQFCTSNPTANFSWDWNDNQSPELQFRIPLLGIRWRVIGLPDGPTKWTRDTIFIDPAKVSKHNAQLEIQIPNGQEFELNGIPFKGKMQAGFSGDLLVLPLAPYGDSIELSSLGQTFSVIVKCEYPIVKSLSAISSEDSVKFTWKTINEPTKLSIVVWNPFSRQESKKEIKLSDQQLKDRECVLRNDDLPYGEWLAMTIAMPTFSGFNKLLKFGLSKSQTLEECAFSIHRPSGRIVRSKLHPQSLAEIALVLSHFKMCGRLMHLADSITPAIVRSALKDSRPAELFRFYLNLRASYHSDGLRVGESRMLEAIIASTKGQICQEIDASPDAWLSETDHPINFREMLHFGIPVGRSIPHSQTTMGSQLFKDDIYPIQYIEDLQSVSTFENRNPIEFSGTSGKLEKCQAASRILDFHKEHGLPSPFDFLPLTRGVVFVERTELTHKHVFEVKHESNGPWNDEDFFELLGLESKGLDCYSIRGDHFYSKFSPTSQAATKISRTIGRKHYTLFWDRKKYVWTIENPQECPIFCCSGGSGTVKATPPLPIHFASTLRKLLNEWTNDIPDSDYAVFEVLDKFNERLMNDDVLGEIHREILSVPEEREVVLHGYQLKTFDFLPMNYVAAIAWQLSWVERWNAWDHCDSSIYPPLTDRLLAVVNQLPELLAEAMDRWPLLMRRCLALAELLYWTYYKNGIGVAAKFSN